MKAHIIKLTAVWFVAVALYAAARHLYLFNRPKSGDVWITVFGSNDPFQQNGWRQTNYVVAVKGDWVLYDKVAFGFSNRCSDTIRWFKVLSHREQKSTTSE